MFEPVTVHRGHEIRRRRPGFEFTPVLLGKITSYLVYGAEGSPGAFAFMYRFPELEPGSEVDEDRLAGLALSTIIGVLDAGLPVAGRDRTFELREGDWAEVSRPSWWIPAFRPAPPSE